MKQFARISATVALVALVVGINGSASAATKRQFSAQFLDPATNTFVTNLCVVKSSTTSGIQFRITNLSKQGPPMRSAGIDAPSNFTSVSASGPTSSTGTWTLTSSSDPIGLNSGGGGGQLKQNGWVQVGLSFTAPSTSGGPFTWPVTAAGPGNSGNSSGSSVYTAAAQPSVTVADSCPTGGGTSAQQSGAGTPCLSPTITGGAGDSLVIGTPGNDVILDLLGNNHVEGRGGNDTICTGPGNDVVLTLGGTDIAFDQGGNNLIRTEAGPDTITTGRGNSRIAAGSGADKVSAGNGKNSIRLGKGRDRATGDSGNDRVWGGRGKDTIAAADGKNRLNGGKGNDKLRAGSGRDRLNGGRNRDTCRADGGKNRFRGCEVIRGRA